jgi:hypothetical protein
MGWVGTRRLQVLAVGCAGRGGGSGHRARQGVGAAADVLGCATGVGAGSGQHTRGGRMAGRRQGWARHTGARQQGSVEVEWTVGQR